MYTEKVYKNKTEEKKMKEEAAFEVAKAIVEGLQKYELKPDMAHECSCIGFLIFLDAYARKYIKPEKYEDFLVQTLETMIETVQEMLVDD